MKYIVIAFILCAGIACSSPSTQRIEITGTVENLEQLAVHYPNAFKGGQAKLMLYEVPFGGEAQPLLISTDSVSAAKKSFTLKGVTPSTGMFDIVVDQGGPMIPLINDTHTFSVNINFATKEPSYTVNGSKASNQLQDFIKSYGQQSILISKALDSVDNLKKLNAPDSILIEATNYKNQHLDELNRYLKGLMKDAENSTVATFVLGRSAQTLPQLEFETALNQLLLKFPEDKNLTGLKQQYENYKTQSAGPAESASWVGKQVPEFALADTAGKSVSLTSFKGKFLLVDFWASWCRPCRLENPNVVAAYTRFKDKNFTILGVSLDKDKENWIQAIHEDGLTWTHISDLAFWNSAAVKTFKFEGIPFNILINPEGVVVAEGLRGDELSRKLGEMLK